MNDFQLKTGNRHSKITQIYKRFGEKARRVVDGTTNEPKQAGMTQPGLSLVKRTKKRSPLPY
jgi:hypothetical protein